MASAICSAACCWKAELDWGLLGSQINPVVVLTSPWHSGPREPQPEIRQLGQVSLDCQLLELLSPAQWLLNLHPKPLTMVLLLSYTAGTLWWGQVTSTTPEQIGAEE